jgi:hypothetical protein
MNVSRVSGLVCLAAVLPLHGADAEAAALLAKSVAAFQQNLEHEKDWNWKTSEMRRLADRNGKPLQVLPQVHSESVILGDGRRCNAVTSWGDGHPAYLKDAPCEDRCQAYNSLGTPFNVAILLKSTNAQVTAHSPEKVTIVVLPDKARQRDSAFGIRCAASIEATIQLDARTLFPLSIEGRLADSRCNGDFIPVMHDTPIDRGPMSSNFRKGSTFRVVWSLQKDRFENPANSFWLITEQHYDQPIREDMTVIYYWGRQFRVRTAQAHRLVKDVTTTAQEFGAGSHLTFR